jgi:hypothetical protein
MSPRKKLTSIFSQEVESDRQPKSRHDGTDNNPILFEQYALARKIPDFVSY